MAQTYLIDSLMICEKHSKGQVYVTVASAVVHDTVAPLSASLQILNVVTRVAVGQSTARDRSRPGLVDGEIKSTCVL